MNKNRIEERIAAKIREIASVAEEIPGVIIIHNIKDLSVVYMSPRGQRILGVNNDELVRMGPEYYHRFFNPDEAQEHVPTMISLLQKNNNEESISLFQQVKSEASKEWTWYSTTVKIFMRDDDGNPLLTIAVAIPIDPKHHITNKVARLLDENNFLRKNYEKFSQLTKRERQVLACMAFGKTSNEIGKELHISVATAETHRKNIKRKLKIASNFDLSLYARAFDLI
ncbi:MAG TPA: LuxR C-terminal-related transcriptional regulator [Chryseosolibacter sp.]